MPWQAARMRTRVLSGLTPLLALLVVLSGCSGDAEDTGRPGSAKTSDADCGVRIPASVFDTLRWSPPKAAESTVRGCHRESEQGYVEVRDRTGDYDQLCRTLDRSGGVGAGAKVDWLGDHTACAVEPDGDVGQTKVLVKGSGDLVTLVTVTAVSSTDQADVRAAVTELVADLD